MEKFIEKSKESWEKEIYSFADIEDGATRFNAVSKLIKIISSKLREAEERTIKKFEEGVITGTDFEGMMKIQAKALDQARLAERERILKIMEEYEGEDSTLEERGRYGWEALREFLTKT